MECKICKNEVRQLHYLDNLLACSQCTTTLALIALSRVKGARKLAASISDEIHKVKTAGEADEIRRNMLAANAQG
jgi:hypothetical protein